MFVPRMNYKSNTDDTINMWGISVHASPIQMTQEICAWGISVHAVTNACKKHI